MSSKIKSIDKTRFNELGATERDFLTKINAIFEINKNNLKCVAWNEKDIQGYLKANNIRENHNTKKKELEILAASPNTLQFRTWKGEKVSYNFISHLRNAYAHLNVEYDPETKQLHLQDWNRKKKPDCTMDARISFKTLEGLVKIILKNYW